MIMNYTKSFFMAALLLLFSTGLRAADVNTVDAQALAAHFLQSHGQGKMMSSRVDNLRLAHTEWSQSRPGSADYYVFNDDAGGSFVIVAGDDRAVQILAHGDHALDMANIPPNLQWWLDQYKAQIEWLAEQTEEAAPHHDQVTASDTIIEPLLETTWHQTSPFNDQCPVVDGQIAPTGCIATAMAMVMYYWKYPAELPPLPAYVTFTQNVQVPSLPGTQLDWDNILPSYDPGTYTEEQGAAVATLLRYCGQACYMNYTALSGSALQEQQLAALKRFGYNHDAQCLSRDECDDEQWHAMIMEDLTNGRPVLYVGTGFNGSHAFVLDGYADGMYHVNWGTWANNGYFALDALGSGNWAFNFYQSMQYHVFPDPEDATVKPYDFEVSGIYYKRNGNTAQVVRGDIQPNFYSGSITIPEAVVIDGESLAVTAIAPSSFCDCDGLTDVIIPATVTDIGYYAFYNCPALKTVTLLGRNKKMGKRAFAMSYAISKVIVDEVESWFTMDIFSRDTSPLIMDAMLYDKAGNQITDVVIPAWVGTVKKNLFSYYYGLHSVTIEEGITAIEENAFYKCIGLTDVTLPQSLQSIGNNAFSCCSSLTDVEIPGAVTELGSDAFSDCSNLTQVTLNPGLVHLDDYAFYYCTSLKNIKLPNTVNSIGFAVFAGCDSLSSVTLSENLQKVSDYTFYECRNLQEITIPASVTYIGEVAFINCSSLNNVIINADSLYIGLSAFKSCNNLTRVDVCDLASWCRITFADICANPLNFARHLYIDGEELKDATIPAGLKRINDYAFIHCDGLNRLTVNDMIESIGDQAFYGCKQMTAANVGNGVRTIGEKAFNSCSKLTDFTFGSKVDSVGMYAFGACSAIANITCHAVTPPYLRGTGSFADKVYRNAQVYVPQQSIEAYQEALVWKRFAHIEGVNFVAKRADVNGDGEVTIADVNYIIDALMGNSPSISLDVNDDGEISIADINAVIDVILSF